MKPNKYVHTSDDGRGLREVFINGKNVKNVMYADTERGIIRVSQLPIKLDKYRKRIITKTLRGNVEVVFQ